MWESERSSAQRDRALPSVEERRYDEVLPQFDPVQQMRQTQSERRGPGRPANGDTAVCQTCVIGTMEFNERTRDAANSVTAPAWTCDSCGIVKSVRRRPARAAARRTDARQPRAKSKPKAD